MLSKRTTWMRGLAAVASLAAIALAAGPASAYTVHGDWVASDYVTGFAQPAASEEAGPLGLAFDGAGNLLVTDISSGTYHRVPPGGGTAAGSLVAAGLGKAAGLAFGSDGALYMARADQARIDEIDPASGGVVRTVVSGLACPTALATDPLSGDLFASNKCGGAPISRITSPTSARPAAKTYTAVRADGLTFAPDGTLFAAVEDRAAYTIAGTGSATPGQATKLADVPEIDGIAYAPATSAHAAYLVVNRNDGEIDALDFAGNVTPIVTGASRGDLVTVGPDRCVYAALQDRVIKLAPSQGSCEFATPLPARQGVLGARSTRRVVDTAIKAKAPKRVKRGRRFTITLEVSDRSRNPAHKVVVTDTLPKGAKLVKARSAKAVKCTRRGRTVTCRKSTLAARKAFTVRLLVRSRSGSAHANSARVKSSDLDPAPGNNKARTKTKVTR